MQWVIFGVILITVACLAEIEIPPVDINKLDDVSQIKTKCDKKVPDGYEKLKTAINETKTCLEGQITNIKIKDELEEAKKTGSMDEVFAKYCNQRSTYKNCIMKTVNASKNCLDETEINALDTAVVVVEEIVDFACFNDGDRLAMFVAEGGVECVQSRMERITNCINETLKININPSQGLSTASLPSTIPSLRIDKKKCDDLAKIRTCIVTDLENNCNDTTPANIVDALFKFINKSTCKNLKQKRIYLNSNFDQLEVTTLLGSWKVRRSIQWQASHMLNVSAIYDKIAEKCKENGGEQAITNFWDSLHLSQTCFKNKRIFVTPMDEYINTLKNCSSNWILTAEACLPEELKYYPSLLTETIGSLIEFVYNHLNINTLSPKSEIVHCLQRLKSVGIKTGFDSCVQSSSSRECMNFSAINKADICKKWFTLNECFISFIKKTCIRDIDVDRFLDDLTTATQKPCSNVLTDFV